ncbi:MAG: cAMP-activated global transcriptional regulator CRP [Microgenomates bacterium OLB22]|nr:MAG: cAMP-activated global transcriptional regulator CRP [Microgenomates bacterium OLB22]
MDLSEKVRFLQTLPLFAGFTEDFIQQIAEKVHQRDLPKHTIIIEEGDEADMLYIIYRGAVQVYHLNEDGKNIPLNLLKEKDVIGEMALLDGHYRSATVETVLPTSVLTMTAKDFRGILEKEPRFAIRLLTQLSNKIREIDERIIHKEERIPERTMHLLTLFSRATNSPTIHLTHEELADLIGITRPRLTEALHKLEVEGKITLSAHKITLIPEAQM